MNMMDMITLTRDSVEEMVNEEIDNTYEGVTIFGAYIKMSEILHTCRPKAYEKFLNEYCFAEDIIIKD